MSVHGSRINLTAEWCRIAGRCPGGGAACLAFMLLRLSHPFDLGVIVFGLRDAVESRLGRRAIADGLYWLVRAELVEVVAHRGRRGVVKILAVKEGRKEMFSSYSPH